ncbi:MAG: hypothetical protein WCE94_15630 [Candidatus Methanoperedens sp.]
MSFLDKVREDRLPLANVLKKHPGIRKIVEDLYPDRAHFIFELLQNAEDAGATEGRFTLGRNSASFEHNGHPFTEENVWGITDIGAEDKKEDKIGRFGVGFKAVFGYCETPHIWSPTFSFKISELVLPTELKPKSGVGKKTYFEFPFNNPKKPVLVAYEEIKAGLEELAETTLLFLSGITSIHWQIDQQPAGEVLRINHSEHHIEVRKRVGGKTTSSSHFLRFSDAVDYLDKRCVAIAFGLDFLPSVTAFDAKKPLNKQLKIIPANPGRVAVFFPAEKETSGLRFHLHAPFVPELSRASIKKTPANEPLFKQLAGLAASSLHTVRNLKLLTADFLDVLPNSEDTIPEQYQPIYEAIITEMNDKPLTPTQAKKHEPAKHLLQAKASLKVLLSEEDLEFLVDYDEESFKWAIGAQQKNSNVDNFLTSLAIQEWDVEAFLNMLEEKASDAPRFVNNLYVEGPDAEFMKWLTSKPDEWHQELYSLLSSEYLIGLDYNQKKAIERLKHLKIVRLSNGGYSTGSKCYFPRDDTEHDELLPRIAKGVYLSGKSKLQQEAAMKLLLAIGVRIVGEAEQVEAILKKRYTAAQITPNINDLKQFISLVEKESQQAKLFAGYYIFERKDGKWGMPSQVFLDDPFMATGLSVYYDALGEKASRMALARSYQDCGIHYEKIARFAIDVGVQARLMIDLVSCSSNPDTKRLVWEARGNWSHLGRDRDYTITGLKDIIDKQDKALSSLIWRTLCRDANPDWIIAQYRNNASHEIRSAPSQLICILRDAKWVPQNDEGFVRPREASRELLPEGFPFDAGQAWLKAVHFGEDVLQRSEEQSKKQAFAKELGFPDQKSLEDAKWFAGLTEEERERFKAEHESRYAPELPDQEPANPEHRNRRVGEEAAGAPKRRIEKHLQSISMELEKVKKETEPYLLQQYTKDDQIICQVCKKPMPFKLDNGRDYFEKVEFLPELEKHYYQNYLALCPNHAAMFQHANGSRDMLKDMFLKIESNELEVVLAQKDTTIYFTKTHIADLKTVIKVDQQENEPEEQS